MLTQSPSGDAPDAEAQLLVHALRAGRLTVLVGAVGVDKTTLLVARVLPLLRRGVGELLHFVAQWNQAPLDSLLRALAALPAAAPVRFDLAEAMSPVHLSALSRRHGGARLLFVFDHFELLLQDAMHNASLQRFVDAWSAVVQAPDLNAHFLVAVDERAWLLLQALCASTTPQVELRAFRLETRSGRLALESLTVDQPGNGAAKNGVKPADFAVLLSESLAKTAREAPRQGAEAAGAGRDARARRITEVANAVQAERNAEAATQAEAAGGVDAQRLAQALAAAEATAAREVQARKVAEAAAKAAQAERHAEAERTAEAARQAEAASRVEVQRLAQALAAAEATAAREVQARTAAEAAAEAAQAERRAEAERNAEAARQAEAARRVEVQGLAQALAAAEAAARRGAEAQQRAPEELVIAAAATSPPEPGAIDSAAGWPSRPAAATAGPARTVLLLGGALLAAAVAAVLWWPTRPTAPAAPVVSPPAATAPALPHTADSASAAAPSIASASTASASTAAAEPAPAGGGRYEVLAAGPRARVARELAAALSTATTAMRVVPVADATDPITWLRAPDRLAIARLDALRTAGGSAAPPLRVLTPLFSESVLFIVRADSPLKYFHQLRGKRLSIGPAAGPGSHTVRETYRRLFGAEMSKPAQFDTNQALGELVAFRSIDAVAIVEPRPSAWRASLDPKIAKRLRLLTLDPRHPADRKLLQTLGTQVARIGAGSKKGAPTTTTPTVMSYLVVSGKGDEDVDRLTAMAHALCRELPRLRKQGDPIWRELQPSAQLDTGWPVVRPFQSALSSCARR